MKLILRNKWKELDEALYHPAKYVVIDAARRSGKTYNTVQWLLDELISGGAKTALWVDTKHTNLEKYVERYFRVILSQDKDDPIWAYCHFDKNKKVLTLPNGEYIDFASAERPELMEGFEYERVVLNEAGIILKKATLWDDTIEPMTRGNNKTRIIGSTKGRNKFHTLSRFGFTGEPDYQSFHFDAYDSPYWDKDELDLIKKRIPDIAWRQNYMSEFLEGSGSVFRGIDRCYSMEQYDRGKDGKSYAMGIDVAKYQDFTVMYVAEIDTARIIYQNRFNQVDWVFQKKRIIEVWQRFNQPQTIMDSTGVGDSVLDDLRGLGMSIEGLKFTNASKNDLIRNLSIAIDSQSIHFFPFDELVSELEVFEYDVKPSGTITYSAPDGFHDDCVIALALVCSVLKKNLFQAYSDLYGGVIDDQRNDKQGLSISDLAGGSIKIERIKTGES